LLSGALRFAFPIVNAGEVDNIRISGGGLQKPVTPGSIQALQGTPVPVGILMASDNDNPQEATLTGVRGCRLNLTELSVGETRGNGSYAGGLISRDGRWRRHRKVAEWLREAALAHARAGQEETDPILLAEIMGMRSLMLNLFARASEGPLTTDDLRKMSAYSNSIKEQRAQDYMTQRRPRNSPKTTDKP
jgi:hypothetical protein